MDARAGRVQGLIELEAAVAAPNYAPLPVVLEYQLGPTVPKAPSTTPLTAAPTSPSSDRAHSSPKASLPALSIAGGVERVNEIGTSDRMKKMAATTNS
mgnify:CR=1 FL=1